MNLKINNIVGQLNITTSGVYLNPKRINSLKENIKCALIEAMNELELKNGSELNVDCLVKKINIINE